MSLYNKVRPPVLSQVMGNREVIESIKGLLEKDNPPHAYLMIGPSGCGKTTLGRIIASELGSKKDDYREYDSADFRGIDTIREIRRGSQFMPLHGPRRCWLLDEVHKLTNDAQNALLKALEDPPAHCYYVLCTTDPDKLLDTIKSRCSVHRVTELSENECIRLLHRISVGEGVALQKSDYQAIYERTGGKPRAAIQLLEKILVTPPESRAKIIANAEGIKSASDNLAKELMRPTGWKMIAGILSEISEDDVETVRRAVLGYCSKVLLGGENDRAQIILDQMIEPFFNSGKAGLIWACYTIVKG